MLPLYTIIILALGAAAEQLLNGENPTVALIAGLIAMLLLGTLWRVRVIVRREGRWQMDFGLFRMTVQSRIPPEPQQANRHTAPRRRGRSCSR